MIKAILIVPLFVLASTAATAQDIPPLAPLRGDAAGLKDTMNFIVEKLPVAANFIIYRHNNITGTDDPPIRASQALTQASSHSASCSISFHLRFGAGTNAVERDGEIPLKQVQEISFAPWETAQQQANAKAGHPEQTVKVDPPITLVVLKIAPNQRLTFNFYDESLAERVSRALQHAVSLCGGGKPETF